MNSMPKENGVTDRPQSSSFPVIPLPIALYVSHGLIFELYNGGQPTRSFSIRWERFNATAAEVGRAHSQSS
jgi:hypothetical protein